MNILITVLLVIGMFNVTLNKKTNFSMSLITNIIIIILLWTKIF